MRTALAFSLLLTSVLGCRESTPSTMSIAAASRDAVVTIYSLDADGDTLGQGSGFFIDSSGTLITNFHVLRGARGALVTWASGLSSDSVTVLAADSLVDVALLRVAGKGFAALALSRNAPSVGEKVVVVGSPLGLANSVSDGIVSGVRVDGARTLIQVSAAISAGSSGGPVMDSTGRVIAVATASMEGGEALNFAVPTTYVLPWLGAPLQPRSVSQVFGRRSVETQAATQAAVTYQLAARYSRDDGIARTKGLLIVGQAVSFAGEVWETGAREGPVEWPPSGRRGVYTAIFFGVPLDATRTPQGGMRLQGTDVDDAGEVIEMLVEAIPVSLPLSDVRGLYDVRLDGTDDFEMAVWARSDSIWVDMRDLDTGDAFFSGAGRLSDGSFRLERIFKGGREELAGVFRAGTVTATWSTYFDRTGNTIRSSVRGRRK